MVAGGSVFDVKVTRPSAWSSNRAPKIGLSVQALAARKTPGPGSYRHERSLVESTSGGRLSTLEPPSMIASMMGERIHYPGPGNYEFDTFGDAVGTRTEVNLGRSPGRTHLKKMQVPGPGAYERDAAAGRGAPGHTMIPDVRGAGGGRMQAFQRAARPLGKQDFPSCAPPVGTYAAAAAKDNLQNGSRGTRFSEVRPLTTEDMRLRRAERLPGPGAYSIPSFVTVNKSTSTGQFTTHFDPMEGAVCDL